MRIREFGLDSISVGELMKSVNLTHGGFYGHFESRADLIQAALARALAESEEKHVADTGRHGASTVKSIVNSYLSPAHRDHPGTGCALAAVAGEVGRAAPEVREVMKRQLDRSIDIVGSALDLPAYTEQFAAAAWAMMIGALTMSRVYAGDPRSDEILAAARRAILDLEALYRARAAEG
jgi:TetR/AcrR family transcriptional repressor of nem operon